MTSGILRKLLERPIAFYPVCADIMGGVAGGVVLSQLLYWASRSAADDTGVAIFWKTDAELREETRCSRRELEEAKARLRQLPFIQVERRGMPARTFYTVDLETFAQFLKNPSVMPELPPSDEDDAKEEGQQVSAHCGNKLAQGVETSLDNVCEQVSTGCGNCGSTTYTSTSTACTETTTETTTENNNSFADCASAIGGNLILPLQGLKGKNAKTAETQKRRHSGLFQEVAAMIHRVLGTAPPATEVRSCLRFVKEAMTGDAPLSLQEIESVWRACRAKARNKEYCTLRWVLCNWTTATSIARLGSSEGDRSRAVRTVQTGAGNRVDRVERWDNFWWYEVENPAKRDSYRTVALQGIAQIQDVLARLQDTSMV